MSNLWGEFPAMADNRSMLTAEEIEQLMKPQPLHIEGAILHQPSSKHLPQTTDPYPAEHFDLDPVVVHTIHLLQYAHRLREMIQTATKQLDAFKLNGGERPTFSVSPPIPDGQVETKRENVRPAADSRLSDCSRQVAPPIGTVTCRKLLRRSVATICAHSGYDTCRESVLELLTDISAEYFIQMTKLLRRAVDNEALDGTSGFQDVLERVLIEMGTGGRAAMHDFHASRITAYHRRTHRQCQDLLAEYDRLTGCSDAAGASGDTLNAAHPDEVVSDIQFPRIDDLNDHSNDDSQIIQLEGLGLDVGISQDTNEEDSRWSQTGNKADMADTTTHSRPSESDNSCQPASVDVCDNGDSNNMGDTESGCEIISPPSSIGSTKIGGKPSRKRRRR